MNRFLRVIPCICMWFSCAIFVCIASADTLILKNGGLMQGKIIKETEDAIVIRLTQGKMTVARYEIKEVHRDSDKQSPPIDGIEKIKPLDPIKPLKPAQTTDPLEQQAVKVAIVGPTGTQGASGLPQVKFMSMEEYQQLMAQKRQAKKAARNASEEEIAALVKQSASDKPKEAGHAISQLALTGADEAYDVLISHLGDEAYQTRNAAISGLAEYGDARGIKVLEDLLIKAISPNPPKAYPTIIVPALEKAKSPSSVAVLTRVAKDAKKAEFRRIAVWSLGKMGYEEAYPAIEKASHDKAANVRDAAGFALGKLGLKKGVPTLIRLLKDKDGMVRMEASRALDAIPDPSAIPALIQAVSDKHAGAASCLALGKLKAKDAIPALTRVLHSKDRDHVHIRQQAARALGMIGEARAVDDLLVYMEDTSGLGHMCAYALSLIMPGSPDSQKPAHWKEWAKQNNRWPPKKKP